MCEVINNIFDYLIANYALYMVVTMSVIITFTIGLLALIKKPIKKLTSKIHQDKIRKLANKMFIFFAFGISFAVWFFLDFIAPQYFSAEALEILLTGAFSIVVYALGDGIVTKSTAKQLVEQIKEIDEKDAEEIKKSKDPINEFWKKVK